MARKRLMVLGALMAVGAMPAWAHGKPTAAQLAHRAALYRALKGATAITEGRGSRTLYDFFDPNCPYCHILYVRLKALIGPYGVTVHDVPVAYLTPTSLGKAAALLEAPNPVAAMTAAQAHYSWKTGSSIGEKSVTPEVKKELAINMKLDTEAAGFPLVPILVYKKADGTIRIISSGAPPVWALKQVLASIKR